MMEQYDVVIIGGGAAGLSAATVLGRFRRSVLVVDAGEPRNAPAEGVHNFLTRDGMPPAELLAAGRAEAEGYGVRIERGAVTSARRDDGFVLGTTLGEVRARRILLASGTVDELPAVEGLAERWGHDVIHCPYCHGWEVRDRPIGVLGSPHQAMLFRQLSDRVIFFGDDDGLRERGITVVEDAVEGIVVRDGRLAAVLAGGVEHAVEALAVATRLHARAGMLAGVGIEAVEHPAGIGTHVPADPRGQTAVPGVWAAGNVTDPMAQVVVAAAQGMMAGAAINGDLVLAG
ncbi:MAG: thioredoxin reductase [Micrococcales bacterium 70-64]|nr:NAD(P)/FAD-dependent oxidoreductase [Leifsonia sp.]ODU64984.1 MAG: thioredoxin reductase [Leifsonia sp. SCN 70-46]OJX86676.1 MAG: thioredoxin reductase [Micrococcales bacterium 70-64]